MGTADWIWAGFIAIGALVMLGSAIGAFLTSRRRRQSERAEDASVGGIDRKPFNYFEAYEAAHAEHRRLREQSPYVDQSKPCTCPDCISRARQAAAALLRPPFGYIPDKPEGEHEYGCYCVACVRRRTHDFTRTGGE